MRRILLAALPIMISLSVYLGVGTEAAISLAIIWGLNDLKGSEESFIIRNIGCSLAYCVCNWSCLKIICGSDFAPNSTAFSMNLFVTFVISLTMHMQDFRDEEGDVLKGRRTLPMIFGDAPCRWATLALILGLSAFSVWFTDIPIVGGLLILGMGLTTGLHLLLRRNPDADEISYCLWAVWVISLFLVPSIANSSVLAYYWSA